jgi:23S rRNA pseudouridine1911/1915/1917 synthase
VEELPAALRLDRYVAEKLGLLTRSQIKARALEGWINGRRAKLSSPVKNGDLLDLSWAIPEPGELLPEERALDLLYEDDRVVVVNKPQGMVVHPGAGNRRGTLANALLARRLIRGGVGEGFRPGIVHRLDKDTSGVIIAAYDDESLVFLAEQFKMRTVRKLYTALVSGTPPQVEGRIITKISRDSRNRKRFAVAINQGKIAVSAYRVIRSWGNCSLIALRPRTGRTHQLRVHMAYLGCPILGDPLYQRDRRLFSGTLMLHAKSLSLVLPGEAEPRTFTSPLPARFCEFLGKR